jgi:acyl-CoA thioester hydrolase
LPTSDVPYSGTLALGVHRFAVRVYYEDTDLTGIVYHANYLRFMERARSDMLRWVGIEQQALHAAGEGYFSVYDMALTWHAPARLDDALVVQTRVAQVRAAAVVLDQQVWRSDQKLTSARVTAAWLGANGRPQRQPAHWDAAFKALLAEAGATD